MSFLDVTKPISFAKPPYMSFYLTFKLKFIVNSYSLNFLLTTIFHFSIVKDIGIVLCILTKTHKMLFTPEFSTI